MDDEQMELERARAAILQELQPLATRRAELMRRDIGSAPVALRALLKELEVISIRARELHAQLFEVDCAVLEVRRKELEREVPLPEGSSTDIAGDQED